MRTFLLPVMLSFITTSLISAAKADYMPEQQQAMAQQSMMQQSAGSARPAGLLLHCLDEKLQANGGNVVENFHIADNASWIVSNDIKLVAKSENSVWIYESRIHEILNTQTVIYFKPYDLRMQYITIHHNDDNERVTRNYVCSIVANPFAMR